MASSTHAARHVAKRWIAAEKLVATQAGNRHLQSQFARRFADEPGVETIDRGLVHRIENFRQIIAEFLLGHDTRGVSRPVLRRDLRRDRRLVLASPAKFFEGQRHRLDVLLSRIAHQTDQSAGVDSAGKECTDRNVGYEMVTHAVEERIASTELLIFVVCGRAR